MMSENAENGLEVHGLNENKYKNPLLKENEELLENGIKRRKWFDKGLFNDDISSSDDEGSQSEDAGEFDENSSDEEAKPANKKSANKGFVNPLKKSHLSAKATGGANNDSDDDSDANYSDDDSEEDASSKKKKSKYIDMYNDDLYIGKRPMGARDIDPDEKVPGELSDDDAYVI